MHYGISCFTYDNNPLLLQMYTICSPQDSFSSMIMMPKNIVHLAYLISLLLVINSVGSVCFYSVAVKENVVCLCYVK